jgi:hypothetical protein
MPPTSELPAYVSEVRFYRDVLASTLSAKRVAAQIIVSRQLLTQSTGTVALDQYLADKMRVAFASVLDQACLYGAGGSAPTGVVHVAGSQNVTTASPPVWADLAEMRYLTTNYDANLDSSGGLRAFGQIRSNGRPPSKKTVSAGSNGSFEVPVEAGEMTGFRDGGMRTHGD